METYTKVFTDNSIIVTRLQSLLNEAKIHSRIQDHVESARLAGFGAPTNGVQLFVLNKDAKTATAIIESFQQEINS